ncbi:MAG: hypothetical protein QNK22_07660 [Xanthomonadales bacterium]|nr:hypothetical protein [Xanthomonadales bacterium]
MRKFLLIYFVAVFVAPLHADMLFETPSAMEIELTGPMSSLVENKEDRKEWPFRLRSDGVELDLKVRARGNSRMRVCDFPPLRFNFKVAETAGTPFEGQDKLKLVTRCKKGSRSEGDVLEEYASYRIFSLWSDVSFRVQLVHMTNIDTDGGLNKSFRSNYGFLVEPLEQMVSRVNGSLAEIPAVSLGRLDKKQAALVYVFQYLIANTDWSFVTAENDEFCCHNIELIKIGSKLFPVPYDFDLSGIVNARYARPDLSLNISRVVTRRYRGFCTDPEVLRRALNDITSRKKDVLDIISSLPVLTDKEKQKKISYLEGFFRKAEDQDKMIKMFERDCHP